MEKNQNNKINENLGLGTEFNKFADTDMWSFPVLQIGVNKITSITANCTI